MLVFSLQWSACTAPGYYVTQWTFTSNDPNEPSLVWPVRLRVLGAGGIRDKGASEVPNAFRLLMPYPNPFNARVSLPFVLPHDGIVLVDLYNVSQCHSNTSSN